MIEDLFGIHYIALAFLGMLILLWIVLELSGNRPRRERKEKSRIFACGMEASPGQLNVSQESYYEYMKRFLGSEPLARLHSGRLSDYVTWIIFGTVLIMAMMLML